MPPESVAKKWRRPEPEMEPEIGVGEGWLGVDGRSTEGEFIVVLANPKELAKRRE